MQQQQTTGRPRIRIWASDVREDSDDYQIMKKLADHIDFLDEILFENGIMEADFMPNLTWSTRERDSDIHAQLHSSPDTPYLTEPLRRVRTGIFDRTGLDISLHRPFTDHQRETKTKESHLTIHWTN